MVERKLNQPEVTTVYNKDLISVILPVYNGETYIRSAIQSILNQTYENFELIIINDGSKDNTSNIISSIKDKRIKLFNYNNSGVAVSLNRGLNLASGKIIARMDADDLSRHDRLEKQVELLNEGYDIIGCDYDVIDDRNKNIGYVSVPKRADAIRRRLFFGPPFAHGSVMARKTIDFQYDELRYLKCEDYALWCKLQLIGYTFGNVSGTLYDYRVSTNQVTRKNKVKLKLDSTKVSINYASNYFFHNA
jgi:glycosyltransferase involved in cell wall biosynthesis